MVVQRLYCQLAGGIDSMLVSKMWTERIIVVAIDEAHLPEFTCQ